jgi:hypothetical protein
MEHWILPGTGCDFIYTRKEGEASRLHELTDVMLLTADGLQGAPR